MEVENLVNLYITRTYVHQICFLSGSKAFFVNKRARWDYVNNFKNRGGKSYKSVRKKYICTPNFVFYQVVKLFL